MEKRRTEFTVPKYSRRYSTVLYTNDNEPALLDQDCDLNSDFARFLELLTVFATEDLVELSYLLKPECSLPKLFQKISMQNKGRE